MDVAVFCLSLMGTNFPSYVEEGDRVLRNGGWLVIAEVKSRLDPSTGGADICKFVEAICEVGFRLVSKVWNGYYYLNVKMRVVYNYLLN